MIQALFISTIIVGNPTARPNPPVFNYDQRFFIPIGTYTKENQVISDYRTKYIRKTTPISTETFEKLIDLVYQDPDGVNLLAAIASKYNHQKSIVLKAEYMFTYDFHSYLVQSRSDKSPPISQKLRNSTLLLHYCRAWFRNVKLKDTTFGSLQSILPLLNVNDPRSIIILAEGYYLLQETGFARDTLTNYLKTFYTDSHARLLYAHYCAGGTLYADSQGKPIPIPENEKYDPGKSIAEVKKAILYNPDLPQAYVFLGQLSKKTEDKRTAYKKAISISKPNSTWHVHAKKLLESLDE